MKFNRIKEVLKEQGRSVKWLSKKTGKSYPSMSCYVRNHRQPSIELLFKIAGILGVNVSELLIENKKDCFIDCADGKDVGIKAFYSIEDGVAKEIFKDNCEDSNTFTGVLKSKD